MYLNFKLIMLLLFISGCSASPAIEVSKSSIPDGKKGCVTQIDRSKPCIPFDSWDEAQVISERMYSDAKKTAEELPVSYDDIAFLALYEESDPSKSYCLSVLGDPPSEHLAQKLSAVGHNPTFCEEDNHSSVVIQLVDSPEPKIYRVFIFGDCGKGPLCGGVYMVLLGTSETGELYISNREPVVIY